MHFGEWPGFEPCPDEVNAQANESARMGSSPDSEYTGHISQAGRIFSSLCLQTVCLFRAEAADLRLRLCLGTML